MRGSGVAAAASTVVSSAAAQEATTPSNVISGTSKIAFKVNGKAVSVNVEPRTTLLDVLRLQLNLTGAKPVCADGSSGASTVLIDGRPAMANTTLALSVAGKEITTSESFREDPVTLAFVEYDAQQCGFCTPGFVVAVRAFLNQHPDATEEQIRAGLNGNICRCGTYANILQAVIAVVKGE